MVSLLYYSVPQNPHISVICSPSDSPSTFPRNKYTIDLSNFNSDLTEKYLLKIISGSIFYIYIYNVEKIVNPKTGKKVNLNSKIGKRVLRNYIKQLGGADGSGKSFDADYVDFGYPIPSPRTCWMQKKAEDKAAAGKRGGGGVDISCGICLEPFNNKPFITSCNHKFHWDCLLAWLRINNNCPMCRNYIPPVAVEVNRQV